MIFCHGVSPSERCLTAFVQSSARPTAIDPIPDAGIAIRYAGDEFIVLLTDADKACVLATINEINKNISRFNDSKAEPFELSVSMGYAEFGKDDNAEVFLRNMDDKMYEEKRRYHGAAPSIPELNEVYDFGR